MSSISFLLIVAECEKSFHTFNLILSLFFIRYLLSQYQPVSEMKKKRINARQFIKSSSLSSRLFFGISFMP